MFRFCVKNRGAISVFLTLILIPTFIFGGVLIDGSRILGAKNLVSGAGDLAMNAALSNYHEGLNQTYGLLAMAESAEEVSSIMEDFFRTTLQAVNVSEEDFSKALVYLEFTHDDFYASDIPGTEIFRTEVFRQEVLEYMKFRAPAIWLDRAIGDKVGQLEEAEKEKNAADGELTFESGLDDVQEIFDQIKEQTDQLEEIYERINDEAGFNTMLKSAKDDYQNKITVLAVAYNSMKEVRDKSLKSLGDYAPSGTEIRGLMEEMVSLSCDTSVIDADNASNIIKMLIIKNNMAGKNPRDVLLDVPRDSEEYKELETLIEEYKEAEAVCEEGISKTKEQMDEAVKSHYTAAYYQGMNDQRTLAEQGKDASDTIMDLIEKLRKELKKSEKDYKNWEEAVKNLDDAKSNKAQYEENLKEYAGFFEEAEGYLGEFEILIQTNLDFYTEVLEKLDSVTFSGKTLDEEIRSSEAFLGDAGQYEPRAGARNIANDALKFFESYQNVESDRMNLSIEKEEILISQNEFVEKMKSNYCNMDSQNEEESQEAVNEWDGELKKKLDKLRDLLLSEKAPNLNVKDWDLPSNWLGFRESNNGGTEGITMGGGLGSKENRKEVSNGGSKSLNTDNEKLAEISSLSEKMGRKNGSLAAGVVESVAEPLLLTEYAMNMFTCYTYDLGTKGEELGPDECQSLSGADMDGNILKYGEIEYILWGIPSLRSNVGATKAVIFAVNLIFNLAFSFTDTYIRKDAIEIAALFPVGALGKTAIKCALQVMVATIETVKNMVDLMDGKAVHLVKSQDDWGTWIITKPNPVEQLKEDLEHKQQLIETENYKEIVKEQAEEDLKSAIEDATEFTYQDYLWILLCIGMYIPAKQNAMLARTADCIELNMTNAKQEEENSLQEMFTMIDLEAAVSIDTFFMQRLSGAGYHVQAIDDETFKIKYYGVQGY